MINSEAFEDSLLSFKKILARKLVAGFAIFCTIGLPISLSRWPTIGFQNIFIHHILLTLIIYICHFRPNKRNYKFDYLVIVLLLSSMVISGTLSFGLQNGTLSFVVFCAFIVALTLGFKSALAYSLLWCCFLLAFGSLYTHDLINISVEPNVYSTKIGAWVVAALGSSLTLILMLITAQQGYQYLLSLINKIETQKQEIEKLANFDALTGCNAARLAMPLLEQSILRAKRDSSLVGVCFMDLNEFKKINDTHGHEVGDAVLVHCASIMHDVLRDMDIVCRIGGDEFMIIIPGVQNRSEITLILKRIVDAWQAPLITHNIEVLVSGSIGVAVYPLDGESAQKLRRNADIAMYQAKADKISINYFSSKVS